MSITGPDWSSQHCYMYSQVDILNPVIPPHATLDSPIVDDIDYSLALLIEIHGRNALMAYAVLAGNDYVKLPGIGWKIAIDIVKALPLGLRMQGSEPAQGLHPRIRGASGPSELGA